MFRAYAKRFKKDDTDNCIYCQQIDTVEHTIFVCSKWEQSRNETYQKLGHELTPDNIIETMIENEGNWKEVHKLIRNIMSNKEKDELRRQRENR